MGYWSRVRKRKQNEIRKQRDKKGAQRNKEADSYTA